MKLSDVLTVLGVSRKGLGCAGLAIGWGLLAACGPTGDDSGDGTTTGTRQLSACTADDPFACEAQTAYWATTLDFRSIDGDENNAVNPQWGKASTALRRTTTNAYGDGISTPAREGVGFSARNISLNVCTTPIIVATGKDQLFPNASGTSDYIWQWGQFLDHDMTLTTNAGAIPESLPIKIPPGDPYFDPNDTGTQTMPFTRSGYEAGSVPRQQINLDTAFIDASMVYGSDVNTEMTLRQSDGTGRLRTEQGNLLPFNINLPMDPNPNTPNQGGLFMAGDERANEQVGLMAMHTLWMREHNRVAGLLHTEQPELSDEQVYQLARAVIGAEIEHITYDRYLPLLLGPDAIPAYSGYHPDVDPRIENLFTILFRVGHSQLSSELQMVGPDLKELASGQMSLANAFFVPQFMIVGAGLEPTLRGLAMQEAQEVDVLMVSEAQDFLFGQPAAGGLDLAALNIQRGRDHGLGSYNQSRVDYGLLKAASFADVTSDPMVLAELKSVYETVDQIDPWLGALAEDHVPGAMVGPLLEAVLSEQFLRTREGDRFWYESALPPDLVSWVKTQTLAMVIRRNTTIGDELPDDVFMAPSTN